MNRKGMTGLQWYRLLRGFCLEEECFVVVNPEWHSKFVEIDEPFDKNHGLHHFRVNVTKTSYGYKIGRGKKNIIVHKSLVEKMDNLLLDSGQIFPSGILIPYDFKSYKESKENDKEIRKEKSRLYKERVDALIRSDPEYAKKVEQYHKRKDWINKTRKKNLENPTKSEELLYDKLLKRFGNKVKVQHQITVNRHIYFLDFYIKSIRLAIEVDGAYHLTKEQRRKDLERDANLASIGIKTVRIRNEQVPFKAYRQEILDVINRRKGRYCRRPDTSVDTYFVGYTNKNKA